MAMTSELETGGRKTVSREIVRISGLEGVIGIAMYCSGTERIKVSSFKTAIGNEESIALSMLRAYGHFMPDEPWKITCDTWGFIMESFEDTHVGVMYEKGHNVTKSVKRLVRRVLMMVEDEVATPSLHEATQAHV